LGGIGPLTTESDFFCPTPAPEVEVDHFYITFLRWEFLLKWYNSYETLLKQRILAVYHAFH